MLQIRLNKGAPSEAGGAAKLPSGESVTVACPDHLVLAELPVAKSLGSTSIGSLVKTIGRRSRRQLGERVHFCVRCDFPIAIYGRLIPCDHAFCMDCARSGSICYLCDERIQKIQTVKMMEGIFVCAAPHCLKSFLKRTEFESHIHSAHLDLLNSNTRKDGNETEAISAKKPTTSDSTGQAPPRPVFSPSSSSHTHDREERTHRPPAQQPLGGPVMQPKPGPANFGLIPNQPSEMQPNSNKPFSGPGPQFPQPSGPLPDFPINPHQPPNFAVPINSNLVVTPPPFNYPPFVPDLVHQQLFVGPQATEGGTGQGSLLGFPPGPAGAFAENFPRPWSSGVPFELNPLMGNPRVADSFKKMSDPQGSGSMFQGGDFGRNQGVFSPSNLSQLKGAESVTGANANDIRDGKGIQAAPPPPPPLPPPQLSHMRMNRDGQVFGWQHERRDSYGSGQD